MAGTKQGALRAREKNLAKNPNFYRDIGSKGGLRTHASGARPKGFAAMTPEKRIAAGARGGAASRKGRNA